MGHASVAIIAIIALLHFYIFIIEAFFWNKPLGLRAFRLEQDFADRTRVLAINQGVYNAFLASGLVYALIISHTGTALFFTSCVAIAGVVGGLTSSKKILLVQTLPATLALTAICVGL